MSDTLIDATAFRDYFSIDKSIDGKRITPHVGAASRRLKSWVGADAYADALSDTPSDALRQLDLKNAEAQLAMHFALPGLCTAVGPNGVSLTTKEAGSVASAVVKSYLRPDQLRELRADYLDLAEEIARPYLISDGTPDAELQFVEG